jgi:hypothetical protein
MTRSDGIVAFISSLLESPDSTASGHSRPSKLCRRRKGPHPRQITRVQLIISERARFHTIFEGDPTATFSSSDRSCAISYLYLRSSSGSVSVFGSEVDRLLAMP